MSIFLTDLISGRAVIGVYCGWRHKPPARQKQNILRYCTIRRQSFGFWGRGGGRVGRMIFVQFFTFFLALTYIFLDVSLTLSET